MMILKGEQTTNLYKMTESIIIGDASATMEKKDTTMFLVHASWTHERARFSNPTQQRCSTIIKYYKLDLCKFYIMDRQHRAAFSTSQKKLKGLLDLIHTDVWGPFSVAEIT